MKKANKPKKHHYLPQSYQKNFTNNKKLVWVYDKKTKTTREQPTRTTGVINDYYTLQLNDENFNTDVETYLSNIDGLFATVFKKFQKEEQISEKERFEMSACISFLYTRTPTFQSRYEKTESEAIKQINKIFYDKDKMKETIKRRRKGVKDLNKIERIIKGGEYDIKFKREESIVMMAKLAPQLISVFNMYEWTIYKSPKNSSFITSDNPIIMLPPSNQQPDKFAGVGLLTPGVSLFFPLSSNLLLVMTGEERPLKNIFYLGIERKKIRAINDLIFRSSLRYVIARDKQWLEKLKKSIIQT